MSDPFHWTEFMMGIGAGIFIAGLSAAVEWWLK